MNDLCERRGICITGDSMIEKKCDQFTQSNIKANVCVEFKYIIDHNVRAEIVPAIRVTYIQNFHLFLLFFFCTIVYNSKLKVIIKIEEKNFFV